MEGSETCHDVAHELGIDYHGFDLKDGFDASALRFVGRSDSHPGRSQGATGRFGRAFGRTSGAAFGARPGISLGSRGFFHRPAVLPGNFDGPCWPFRWRCASVLENGGAWQIQVMPSYPGKRAEIPTLDCALPSVTELGPAK